MTSHNSSDKTVPIPFLFGMALTFEQIDMLARCLLGDGWVDVTCQGDPAYAFDETWMVRGIGNSIIEIPRGDGTIRYLYVLDVLCSFDGNYPPKTFDTGLVNRIWHQLGKPDIWKEVEVVCTEWSDKFLTPEPEWIYPRMYRSMQRSKEGAEERST
ncbi:hypothetical protein D9758_017629 [Tetrapyrgos nigripes]|uniref:Uncharacterized protein n=1 Tax=Tetrapyrgos nigripes TaxID=182062 RepID=A0A8H5CGF2_9AGAR|nr:hypothetical protein D9758_017629 [Tetrapyrgos nigripes]